MCNWKCWLSPSNRPNQKSKPHLTRWHYPLITYFSSNQKRGSNTNIKRMHIFRVHSHLNFSLKFLRKWWFFFLLLIKILMNCEFSNIQKYKNRFHLISFCCMIVQRNQEIPTHTWPERILRSKSNKYRTLKCILISGTHWLQKCNRWKYSPSSFWGCRGPGGQTTSKP